jgi:hypothetical protein
MTALIALLGQKRTWSLAPIRVIGSALLERQDILNWSLKPPDPIHAEAEHMLPPSTQDLFAKTQIENAYAMAPNFAYIIPATAALAESTSTCKTPSYLTSCADYYYNVHSRVHCSKKSMCS